MYYELYCSIDSVIDRCSVPLDNKAENARLMRPQLAIISLVMHGGDDYCVGYR